MKKKVAIILVTGLVIASLAGCGTQADATNQSPESSSVVESEAGTESEAEGNTEDTAETGTDESMSTEVVGDNTGEPSRSAGAEDGVTYTEHEYFYIASELDMSTKEDAVDINALDLNEKTITLSESIPLYELRDFVAVAGYTKPNVTVKSFRSDDEWIQLVFEGEEQYQFMLVKTEDVYGTADSIDEQKCWTPDDIINAFHKRYSEEYSKGNWSIVDIASDMQYVDVEISNTIESPETYVMSMGDKYEYNAYTKFNIEFLRQEDDIMWFRVYYKDLYVSEE